MMPSLCRYDWDPSSLPQYCSCGAKFSVEHSFTCPNGGFPSLRHNEIRDLTANLLSEVCHDVQVEPNLQPISDEQFCQASLNTEEGALLDICICVVF